METESSLSHLSQSLQNLITKSDDAWIYTENDFLNQSPSRQQGLSIQQELKLRESIYNFVVQLGTRMKADGRVILATVLYLHRYYMRLPITSSKYYVASAAFCISCKINDNYRPPDKISLVSCQIRNLNPQVKIDEQSDVYWKWKDQLLMREEMILRKLGFDLNLILPYMFKDIFFNLKGDDKFVEKRADIFKQTSALIDYLSSLPVILCYNMKCMMATCMVITTIEGHEHIDPDIKVPKGFLHSYLNISTNECVDCFNFIRSLLEISQQKNDPQQLSNAKIAKRILEISSETFLNFVEDQ